MLPTTQVYKDAITADDRTFDAGVSIDYSDPFYFRTTQITSSGENNTSNIAQIIDGIKSQTYKYACLDGRWQLNQGYYLTSKIKGELGWVSDAQSYEPYLFPTLAETNQTISSVNMIVDSEGYITLNGTASGSPRISVLEEIAYAASAVDIVALGKKIEFYGRPHTIYYKNVSGSFSGSPRLIAVNSSASGLTKTSGNDGLGTTYIVDGVSDCCGLFLYLPVGSSYINYKFKIQVELVGTVGKNKIDFKNVTFTSLGNATFTKNKNDITVSASPGQYGVRSSSITVEPNTDYIFSYNTQVISGIPTYPLGGSRVYLVDTNYYFNVSTNEILTFNSGSNTHIQILFYLGVPTSNEGTQKWYNVMLEKGNIRTSFEPYYTELDTLFYPNKWLNLNFSSKRIIDKLSIIGDTQRLEYPVNFKVEYFENDVLLNSVSVINNTQVSYTLENQNIIDCNNIKLTISKWSAPNTPAKINELYTESSESYNLDDIESIDIFEELDSEEGVCLGGVIAKTLKLILSNANGNFSSDNPNSPISEYLLSNRLIKPQIGILRPDQTYEYIPMGSYFSENWESNEEDCTVTGLDCLSLMDNYDYVPTVSFPCTLYDLVDDIIKGCKLGIPYVISDYLKMIQINSMPDFGSSKSRQALLLCMEACGCVTECKRDNTIYVYQLFNDSNSVAEINSNDNAYEFSEPKKKLKLINSVTVIAADGSSYTTQNTDNISKNGIIPVTIKENPVIMTYIDAQRVGDWVLSHYNTDIITLQVDWQGDPAIELSDSANITNTKQVLRKYYIISQHIVFEGGIDVTTTGRG